MAELVDALVSNTNDSNVVPVRSRLRVLFKKPQMTYKQSFEVFILADMSAFCPHFFVKLKIFEYWILNKTEADEPPFFTSNGIVPLK